MTLTLRAPEMVEADIVHHRRGGEARDVAAIFRADLVALDHNRHGVPAVDRPDAPFDVEISRILGLLIDRDRVLVGGGGAERQVGAGLAGRPHCVVQQEMRPVRPVTVDHILYRLNPLLCLNGINILKLVCHFSHFLLPLEPQEPPPGCFLFRARSAEPCPSFRPALPRRMQRPDPASRRRYHQTA